MIYKVLSRAGAIAYSYKRDIPKTAIISISNSYDSIPLFAQNQNIKKKLYLFFDDVDFGEPCCISKMDAQRIAEYIRSMDESIEQLIVHCEAGVSRSAGVCAAIMKATTGKNNEIFDNPKFHPNMACYRTVLAALYSA